MKFQSSASTSAIGLLLIPALILTTLPSPGCSQVLIPPYFTGVGSYSVGYLDQFLACRKIVGMSLAVVHWNESFSAGYGRKGLDTGDQPTNQTVFKIASLTKAFTATLVAKLLHEHPRYTLDTTVREILGDDFYFYDALRTNHATVRDLLAHRLGISSNNYVRLQEGFTRDNMVGKLRFLKPIGEFRNSYYYSNLMYGLAAHIAEKLGGKSWEGLVRDHIFEPLGMTSSGFMHEIEDYDSADMALPYLPLSEGGYKPVSMKLQRNWGTAGGSGSITSTASDMTKWLHAQVNGGKSPEGVQVIPEEVLEQTHTAYNIIGETSSDKAFRKPESDVSFTFGNYGLGWRIGYYRGRPIITHTGTSFGYGAKLTLMPEEGIAIYTGITGSDSGYKGRRFLHMTLMDHLLDETKFLNKSSACTFPSETTTPSARDEANTEFNSKQLPLSSYEGTYGNFAYGELTVHVNETRQQLEVVFGPLGSWRLVPTETRHLFTGFGYGDFWQSTVREVMFLETEDNSDNIQSVQLSFDSRDPPVFKRGLRMSNPPPPPEVSVTTCVNSAHSLDSFSVAFWTTLATMVSRLC